MINHLTEQLEAFTTILNGKQVKVTVKVQCRRWDDRARHNRGKAYITVPMPEELGQTAGHPEYGRQGVDPVADAAWKVYNKLEIKNMKEIFQAAISAKGHFSRKAGCSCGCSPGFLLDENHRLHGRDVFVTAELI